MNRSAGFAVTPILKMQSEIPMPSLNAETCRLACKRILPQVGVSPKERGKRLCIQQGFSCCQSGVTGSGLFFTMDANNWTTFGDPSFEMYSNAISRTKINKKYMSNSVFQKRMGLSKWIVKISRFYTLCEDVQVQRKFTYDLFFTTIKTTYYI